MLIQTPPDINICVFRCKLCVEFQYCSEQCQNQAWANFHQWECFGIRAGFFKLSEFQLPALRALFKELECNFETDPLNEISTRYQMRDNSQLIEAAAVGNKLWSLELHLIFIINQVSLITVAYLREKSNFFKTLKAASSFAMLTEEETVSKLGGKFIRRYLQVLSHMISVQTVKRDFPTMVTYATAICSLYSKFKHSCKPNTAV